jgi:hypothetical protein
MDYEQSAHTIANSNRGHSDAAVAFAVLHLAAQVQRVADTLDELVDVTHYLVPTHEIRVLTSSRA